MRVRHGDVGRYLATQPLSGRRLAMPAAVLTTVLAAWRGSPSERPSAPTAAPLECGKADLTRVRAELPAGYEVRELTGALSAPGLWGFGPGWSATRLSAGALAEPADGDPPRAAYPPRGGRNTLRRRGRQRRRCAPMGVLTECSRWTMAFGHTIAEVTGTGGRTSRVPRPPPGTPSREPSSSREVRPARTSRCSPPSSGPASLSSR